jgi:diguanylate cyclase (GGDEF)-like protein
MSLRLRLFLAVTLVIVVHTLAQIVLLVEDTRNSVRRTQQVQGAWTGKNLANSLANPLVTNDLATVQSTAGLLFSEQNFLRLAVLDERGAAIIDLKPDTKKIKAAAPAWFISYLNFSVEPSIQDITIGGVEYGQIVTLVSPNPIIERVWGEAQRDAWVAVVEIVMLSLLLWVLMDIGLRPLQQLSATVRRIGAGDFSARMTKTGSREFGELIFVVNDMSQKLHTLYEERKQAEETVLKLNQDLERRVDARTRELAIANAELTHQALHDALTDIPNRTLLYERLQQAIIVAKRERKSVALMMMDLDRFKEINDTMGHHSGDLVLQAVASRLRSTLRQSDTVARLGGDEFAMVLPGIGGKDSAILAAQKILNAVQMPISLEGRNLDIGASLGIVLYPDQGEETGLLLQRADVAMYAAKRNKSGYAYYDAEADRYSMDRLALQGELRHAIKHGELLLYYQPKIDFSSGRIGGLEALVRWQHPRHGLMFPDDFIPLAERTGLIKPLTEWVTQEALRQCCVWQSDGLPLTIAVNISASNLQDPQFPESVAAALARTGARPEWLELEITETAIMKEPAVAIAAIGKLSHMGVQLAIDDFGTGYSSMAYLKKLLVAKIKIDKSFVMDMNTNRNDAVIVRSLIGLGHNLGLSVVAEGVESAEVWDELKVLGCDSAQGYSMSRPIPPDKLDDWLRHSPWGFKGQ